MAVDLFTPPARPRRWTYVVWPQPRLVDAFGRRPNSEIIKGAKPGDLPVEQSTHFDIRKAAVGWDGADPKRRTLPTLD